MRMLIIAVATLSFGLTGCNTVRGVGDDLKSAANKGEEVLKK